MEKLWGQLFVFCRSLSHTFLWLRRAGM
jgi:hypothetical protein